MQFVQEIYSKSELPSIRMMNINVDLRTSNIYMGHCAEDTVGRLIEK